MHPINSYLQLQVFSILTAVAGTVVFIALLSKHGRKHGEDPLRYTVKPPEAVQSAYQSISDVTLTFDVCS
jgi:hypothetical protein